MGTDYGKIGLKCGLEIHQQLEGRKLHCKCPTEIRDDPAELRLTRRLRAVVGEMGEVDIAAAAEMAKGKYYVYEGFADSTCLVEMDESPPEDLNQEALQTALQVSLLLKAKPVDQVRVMRKIVIDGSNTSGFQRTTLVAQDGRAAAAGASVEVSSVCLEEDSARITTHAKDHTVYGLDRLGIPLLELRTSPDIHTPEQCKAIAEYIGMVIRSTGKAKRGIGTVRQDVNVSVTGGARVEIKGAQELHLLSKLVELEAQRQLALLDLKKELAKRGVKTVKTKSENVSALFAKTGSKIVKQALKKGVVLAMKLPHFGGLLGKEVLPGKRFGTELSDRAKVLAGVGGIFHSDELPAYGITEAEVDKVAKKVKCDAHDAFVLVADNKERAAKALQAVIERAQEAVHGVPGEVRNPNQDGTTNYLRPLPGAARMYPETDVPPVTIAADMLKIKLPELIEAKIARYQKMGLGKDLAELSAKSDKWELFEQCVKRYSKIKPAYIAEVLMTSTRTIKRQFDIDISPTEEDFTTLFAALHGGTVSKESVLEILKQNKPVEDVIQDYQLMSDKELERELKKIVAKNKGVPFNALIGQAMTKLRGKAEGRKIAEFLKKLLP